VGDVDRETAERLVTDGFGNLPEGSFTDDDLMRPDRSTDPDTRLTERELPTNYIMGRYEVPSLDDPDYAAIRVAHYILRDRVFEEVRTKRNLSYAPAAGISFRRDNYGYLYVSAVEPDTTVRVMLAEVRKMQDGEVTEKELADQIKVQITRYLMSQQTTGSQSEELGRWELLGGGWEGAENLVDRVRQVTVDDITRVCQKYIQNIDFVMLGDPQKWEDPLAADQPAGETQSLD
jgi:predicted Zn-dependent peptidase